MSALSLSSIFLLLCLSSRADSLFGHALSRCQVHSIDGHDAVYLEQYYFNKVLLAQYNSTLGKFTGYTEKTKEITDALNKNPAFLERERKNTESSCRNHIQRFYSALHYKTVEPHVRVKSVEAASSRHPAMLVCSAYGFYPRQIRLTWLRNGKEATSDVTYTEELPNGNWLYQSHSYLEYTPIAGEKITCMVEHMSLMEPKLYDWVPVTESVKNKIAIGTAGLLLGLVFVASGLLYYKKKSPGRILVPQN